jgi:hypothetical protein
VRELTGKFGGSGADLGPGVQANKIGQTAAGQIQGQGFKAVSEKIVGGAEKK